MEKNVNETDLSILKNKDKSALIELIAKFETLDEDNHNAEYAVLLDDFYEELGNLKKDQLRKWHSIYPNLLKSKHVTDLMVSLATQKSLSTVRRFRSSPPPDREDVLAIAALLADNLQGTNRLLRLAGFSDLYPKTISDCVWYYVLEHGSHTTPAQSHEELVKIVLNKVGSSLPKDEKPTSQQRKQNEKNTNTTTMELELLASLQDNNAFLDSAFIEFILRNLYTLHLPYLRLLNKIDILIGKYDVNRRFANSRFSNYPSFLDRYYRERQYMKSGRAPSRDFLLALGIHLGMSKEGFNAFLLDANQDPLSPFDITEIAILFVLNHIDVFYPNFFTPGCGLLDDPEIVSQVEHFGCAGYFFSFFREMEKKVSFKYSVVNYSKLISMITPVN